MIIESNGELVTVPGATTPAIARHLLTIEREHHGMPFAGLGLAPDSLFEAFTAHVGAAANDLTDHRVSAGNPLVEDLTFLDDLATIGITLPVSIAPISESGPSATIAVGAAGVVELASGGRAWTWPLPIELYYGGIPPRGARPTYHDRLRLVHVDDGQISTVFFVTDGRRDIELQVRSPAPSGNVGVRIGRLDGRTQDARFDNSEGTLIIGDPGADGLSVPLDAELNRFQLHGEMATMISVQIDGQLTNEANNGIYEISIVAR